MQVHASCAGSRLLPRQLAGLRCRAPHPAAGPGRRARGAQTVYARGGRGQQGRLQQSVQPAPTGWLPNPLANAPWYAGAPAVLLVAFLAVKYRKYARRLYKKVYRRIRGYNYYDDDEDDDEDDECAPVSAARSGSESNICLSIRSSTGVQCMTCNMMRWKMLCRA